MIYDSIRNCKLYSDLGAAFKEAFEFLAKTDFEKAEAGRYPLSGNMFYLVQRYEPKNEADSFFEAHRKFIDLQYVVSGRERHNFGSASLMKQRGEYNAEKDLAVYDGKGAALTMEEGFFAVYFPDDIHMPNVKAENGSEKILKVIVKIPVA